MSDIKAYDDIRKGIRRHLAVAAILILLTITTVVISYIGLEGNQGIAAALGIAALQVTLISLSIMHAWGEGKQVRWLLAFTVFFLIALMGLTGLAFHDKIDGTQRTNQILAADEAPTENDHDAEEH